MFSRLFVRPVTLSPMQVLGGAALGASLYALQSRKATCSDAVHPPELPWSHKGPLDSFDTASIRRGLQVYQQVCAACHSLEAIAFRQLVGVTHDVEGAKAFASKYDIKDGPNDQVCYVMAAPITFMLSRCSHSSLLLFLWHVIVFASVCMCLCREKCSRARVV
jgi:cytochrome c1